MSETEIMYSDFLLTIAHGLSIFANEFERQSFYEIEVQRGDETYRVSAHFDPRPTKQGAE